MTPQQPLAVTLKRIVFRAQIAISALVLVPGAWPAGCFRVRKACSRLLGPGGLAADLVGQAFVTRPKAPGIALVSIVGCALYLGPLTAFLQTDLERRLLRWLIPLSLLAILLCAVGLFGTVFAGLTSHSAGKQRAPAGSSGAGPRPSSRRCKRALG